MPLVDDAEANDIDFHVNEEEMPKNLGIYRVSSLVSQHQKKSSVAYQHPFASPEKKSIKYTDF